jgi:broad specificity phosphatase PhoE
VNPFRPRTFWLFVVLFACLSETARADEAGIAALKAGGHVAIVRHGLTTPEFGDPPGFRLDDCATQRNLVDEGREQARKLGRFLRERGIVIERVLSSPWCRARETAILLELGEVSDYRPVDNLYGRSEAREAQTASLRAAIAGWTGKGNLMIVSHGSVISALTAINPREAEGVVLAPAPGTAEGFRLVGRISHMD